MAPPAPVAAPLAGDTVALERSLNDLEATFEQTESMVALQTELKRRHEKVSALACESADMHARDMQRIVAVHHRRRPSRARATDSDRDSASRDSVEPGSLNGRRLASATRTHPETVRLP